MRLIDADALIADLLTVDPRYTEMVEWCCNVIRQTPTAEPNGDLISRADAIDAVMAEGRKVYTSEYANAERIIYEADAVEALSMLPSADAVHGEWEDKEVFNDTDDDHIVDEWQSARCSVCGKYHTTPYKYYFDNFNFCPNCGAKMKKVVMPK